MHVTRRAPLRKHSGRMRSATHPLARACFSLAAAAIALTTSVVGVGYTGVVDRGVLGLGEHQQGCFELGVAPAAATERGFRVGDLLQAIEDVELDEATIASGSKVSVRAQKKVGGRVLLDLALADGHIVRAVPLTVLRGSFRRVDG
jgi:hypothetical protein